MQRGFKERDNGAGQFRLGQLGGDELVERGDRQHDQKGIDHEPPQRRERAPPFAVGRGQRRRIGKTGECMAVMSELRMVLVRRAEQICGSKRLDAGDLPKGAMPARHPCSASPMWSCASKDFVKRLASSDGADISLLSCDSGDLGRRTVQAIVQN